MTDPQGAEDIQVDRSQRVDRYQEIAGILVDEKLYQLLTPGTFDQLFVGPKATRADAVDTEDGIEVRIRRALERLGPAFIKAGQLAATRRDLVAPALVTELAKLQDDVPSVPYKEIAARVEEELGAPVEEVYDHFDREPLAAASIGQVHRARLAGGKRVVVKVQRPGVAEQMAVDLDIMERQARSAGKRLAMARDLDVPAVANRFLEALRSELDYMREARNMELFRERFEEEGGVAIPWVDWERTTSRVLTMEELDGIPGTRTDEMDAAGVDRAALVQAGVNAYFVQIFEMGSFHSDPHQGNLFAMRDGRVGFVDFGRVSTINDRDRERAMELMSALMDSDEVRATEVLIEVTRADPSIDRAALQVEVADLIDAFSSKGANSIGLDQVFERMFGMIRQYGLQMPDSLAMLFITMGTLEGVANTLDPDFDFMTAAKPMIEELLPQRWGRQRLERAARRSGFRYFRLIEDFPFLADLVLRRAGSGEFKVAIRPTETDELVDRMDSIADKISWSVILAALILGTAILLSQSETVPDAVALLLEVVAILGIITVAWMLFNAFRRGRRKRKS